MHVKSYQDENEALYTKNSTIYLEINIQNLNKANNFNKQNTGINTRLLSLYRRTNRLFMISFHCI